MATVWKIKGLLPYIVMIFMNAFVDLGHKIVIQNTVFKAYDGELQIVLTAVVNGLILLPFLLFFTPSGFVADRYGKTRVMRMSAWAAVAVTALITLCYYQGWFWAAFGMTFLLAVQSAFYSPAKYAYIKYLAGTDRLVAANGVVQATVIIAILAGTFLFSILFEQRYSAVTVGGDNDILTATLLAMAPLGWLLLINSLIELVVAYRLPTLDTPNEKLTFEWRAYLRGADIKAHLAPAWGSYSLRLPMLGVAVFWSVSQVMLAAFPAFAKLNLSIANTVVVQGMLAVTGVGIAIGSLLAGRLSVAVTDVRLLPVAALGLSACLFLVPYLQSVWGHCVNFLAIGVCGGIYVVPLNALIQFHAPEREIGGILAANNFIKTIAMLLCLILTVVFARVGYEADRLLFGVALLAMLGCGYTAAKLSRR